MNTRLQVENLGSIISENELLELFSTFGNVASVRIQISVDPLIERRGFVSMMTTEGALAALQNLHGSIRGDGVLAVTEVPLTEKGHGFSSTGYTPRRTASRLF